jgi:hypothetical protein
MGKVEVGGVGGDLRGRIQRGRCLVRSAVEWETYGVDEECMGRVVVVGRDQIQTDDRSCPGF